MVMMLMDINCNKLKSRGASGQQENSGSTCNSYSKAQCRNIQIKSFHLPEPEYEIVIPLPLADTGSAIQIIFLCLFPSHDLYSVGRLD